jgi:hypothetical protein
MPRKPGPRPVDRPESKGFTFVLPIALIDQTTEREIAARKVAG